MKCLNLQMAAKSISLALVCFSITVPASADLVVDQENDVPADTSTACPTPSGGRGSIFQTFTPSASTLDAVKLRLRAGGGPSAEYTTIVIWRGSTPDSPAVKLGAAVAFAPMPPDVFFFFSEPLALIPGDTHVIEWISPKDGGLALSWFMSDSDTYSGGTAGGYCSEGGPVIDPDHDMIFTTYTDATLVVPGLACVQFAGQTSVPAWKACEEECCEETEASIPPFVSVCSAGTVSIHALGTWGHPTLSGPDGYLVDWFDGYTEEDYVLLGGIQQVVTPLTLNTLVGVFLTDDPPDPLAIPPALVMGDDMTTPQLQQAFAIGSELYDVRVPAGATRLFLGLKDSWEWCNNVGELYVNVTLSCDTEGPITSDVLATPNPVPINSPVAITANVDDTATGGREILSAECSLADGDWFPMAAQDGLFDEVSEDVMVTLTAPSAVGVYALCVGGTDIVPNVGDPTCTLLVVYDPDGGFVTGGGWIDSPEGAYVPDPTLMGKANFGFVSKYKKGATVPTGNTEFVFKTADLNFHSSSYDWLLVTGSNYAKFKGSGTINGSGDYRFMLWAGDGDPDTFRIKIWEEDEVGTETVVYDNGFNQAIGGGSIVIHAK